MSYHQHDRRRGNRQTDQQLICRQIQHNTHTQFGQLDCLPLQTLFIAPQSLSDNTSQNVTLCWSINWNKATRRPKQKRRWPSFITLDKHIHFNPVNFVNSDYLFVWLKMLFRRLKMPLNWDTFLKVCHSVNLWYVDLFQFHLQRLMSIQSPFFPWKKLKLWNVTY